MKEMEREPIPKTVLTASLYKRLERIEPLCRIILSHAELSALLTFRGEPEQTVLLDYTKYPGRIEINGEAADGRIFVTIRGDVMHDVLTGKITPGTAIARREMLLRGSASHLARFIPMLDFGGLLYREHLADVGYGAYARTPQKEAVMNSKTFNGDPIPLVRLNPVEKTLSGFINGAAYAMGYVVGFLRYRVIKKLSLFNILAAMSRGLEAATPVKAGPEN